MLLPQLFHCWFFLVYYFSLFFSSSRFLVNISCVFSIAFLRSWIIFTIIVLILFLEGCRSLLHLVVFLGFYLVPSSGVQLCAFSCWLTFCNAVFVLVAVGLWFFLLLLSALWWRRLKGLCKLPDRRGWQWEKLGPSVVGRILLSKALIQLSADGWGCTPSLIFWPEATHPSSLW